MPSVSFNRVINAPMSEVRTHPGGAIETSTSSGRLRTFVLEKTWQRTPGYFKGLRNKSIRKRDLPMHDYSYHKQVINHPYGYYTLTMMPPATDPGPYVIESTGAVESCSPHLMPGIGLGLPPIDLEQLDSQARTASLLGLKDQKVNLVQAFAERGQTVRLIGNTINRLAGAASSLRKGQFAAAARSLGVQASPRRIRKYTKSWSENQSQALANGWLELQYGWRPLLNDIYGAAEQLAQINVREVRNIVKKSVSRTIYERGRLARNTSPFVYYDIKRKVTIKYVIYFSTPVGNHSLTQIGLTNPALIAWELTPWSFVIDWLLPIGDYISSLDATSGLVFEKGCKTIFEERTSFCKGLSGPAASPGFTWSGSVPSDSKEIWVTRQVLSDFPESSLPALKNPFSTTHVLNALALLKTNLRVR